MITHYDFAFAITTSDSTVYDPPLDGIYVGGAGNLAFKTPGTGATAVTLTGVVVGSIIPVRARIVMATNTTATLLIGLRAGPPLA